MDSFDFRLKALEAKIDALETQNRRWKTGTFVAAACVAASLALIAASPSTSSQKISLVDPSTGVRVELGGKGLKFTNSAGKALANFWVDPKMGSGLVFSDQNGHGRVGIGMWGKSAGLGIDAVTTKERVWLGEEDKGTSFNLYDAANVKRLTANAWTGDSQLYLSDKNGKYRTSLYAGGDGESGFVAWDADQKPRARVFVSDKPGVNLLTADGTSQWSAP